MPTPKTLKIALSVVVLGAVAAFFVQRSNAAGTLTTQDLLDIQQMYSRYYHTIDAGDSEGWADTFTPDGVFNTNTRGATRSSNPTGAAGKTGRCATGIPI